MSPEMMVLLWVLLWVLLCSALPHPALFSHPDYCSIQESSSSQTVSPLLQSLQCYNDYQSHVLCSWMNLSNSHLELWLDTEDGRKLCEPLSAADPAEAQTVHCRYKTSLLSIGVKHTGFFLKNNTENICSVRRTPLDLFHHVRALPPVNLTTHEAADGGWRILWSSPYPSSSSLSRNLSYQLSYRTDRQDIWTTENVSTSSLTLGRSLLLPGQRYEARVRVLAGLGQWSDWSPVVTWRTEEDSGHIPMMHCVLEAEREVLCSWEVKQEVADSISYQLLCRRNPTSQPERCCMKPVVRVDHQEALLSYSCSLDLRGSEHLLLELQPSLHAKTFEAHQHIRPKPPQQLQVRQQKENWMVEWMEPSTASRVGLSYQVWYCRTPHQGSPVLLNISEGSLSVSILGGSLDPFQTYQVKVRSLLVPGDGSLYEGIPSEWSDPVEWTSHGASWSPTTFIYILISVFVASVFFILYWTIPACHRKVVLWEESVPSPEKSKILSEIKSSTTRTLMQSEKTSICKVQHQDSVSTCSSDALLWSNKPVEPDRLDRSCWDGDVLSGPAEKLQDSDTSSMSFSGPYIFCQSSKQTSQSVSIKSEDKEPPSDVSASPPLNFTVFGDGYVHLPRPNVSRSTQDLVSHGNDNTSPHEQRGSDLHPGLRESSSRDQPPEYTSEAVSSWPQSVDVQASGYCHLPTAFIPDHRGSIHSSYQH